MLHLRHHCINAVKYRAIAEEDEIADALIAECRTLNANLLVMGSYGHSRLHELLPGSTTDRVLARRSPCSSRTKIPTRPLPFRSSPGGALTVVKVTAPTAS